MEEPVSKNVLCYESRTKDRTLRSTTVEWLWRQPAHKKGEKMSEGTRREAPWKEKICRSKWSMAGPSNQNKIQAMGVPVTTLPYNLTYN